MHNEYEWQKWSEKALKKFRKALNLPFIDDHSVKENYIVIIGKTQVGKTNLALKLLRIEEKDCKFLYNELRSSKDGESDTIYPLIYKPKIYKGKNYEEYAKEEIVKCKDKIEEGKNNNDFEPILCKIPVREVIKDKVVFQSNVVDLVGFSDRKAEMNKSAIQMAKKWLLRADYRIFVFRRNQISDLDTKDPEEREILNSWRYNIKANIFVVTFAYEKYKREDLLVLKPEEIFKRAQYEISGDLKKCLNEGNIPKVIPVYLGNIESNEEENIYRKATDFAIKELINEIGENRSLFQKVKNGFFYSRNIAHEIEKKENDEKKKREEFDKIKENLKDLNEDIKKLEKEKNRIEKNLYIFNNCKNNIIKKINKIFTQIKIKEKNDKELEISLKNKDNKNISLIFSINGNGNKNKNEKNKKIDRPIDIIKIIKENIIKVMNDELEDTVGHKSEIEEVKNKFTCIISDIIYREMRDFRIITKNKWLFFNKVIDYNRTSNEFNEKLNTIKKYIKNKINNLDFEKMIKKEKDCLKNITHMVKRKKKEIEKEKEKKENLSKELKELETTINKFKKAHEKDNLYLVFLKEEFIEFFNKNIAIINTSKEPLEILFRFFLLSKSQEFLEELMKINEENKNE